VSGVQTSDSAVTFVEVSQHGQYFVSDPSMGREPPNPGSTGNQDGALCFALSHPFIEQLIGTIRRECLDPTFFWATPDLEAELLDFQHFYNGTHARLGGQLPEPIVDRPASRIDFASYGWLSPCRGLYQAPIAT